jgi:uncharacterized membrane protein SpoIIM required for sporulation
MLESLLSLRELDRRPYMMLPWAFIMGSIGTLIALQVSFPVRVGNQVFDPTGIFAVLFTVIPSVYFLMLMIRREELADENPAFRRADAIWARHGKDMLILCLFFLGLSLAFSFWSFVLHDTAFQMQLDKISQIRGSGDVTGNAAGDAAQFSRILVNNLNVMLFSFIFSLIFGAGAIFIIVWNASILGVFVGARLSSYVWEIPYNTGLFLPHGIPEIAGYLFAGLSGGIISTAVLRGRGVRAMKTILVDALLLMGLAAFSVLCGAAIEALDFAWQVAGMAAFYGVVGFIMIHALTYKFPGAFRSIPIAGRKR